MRHRNNIGKYLTSLNLVSKGVEIGCFKGEFSRTIVSTWPGILYMVDPWRPLGDEYIDNSNHKNHSEAYSETMGNIGGYEDRAIMVRALSEQAVNLFEDNSLDFIYIDGNHAYDFVKQDIELWYPKVKKGGLISGHDYLQMDYSEGPFLPNGKDKQIFMTAGGKSWDAGVFGVNPAVDEFCIKNGYEVNLNEEGFCNSWWFLKK